jgi:hypothetical protein
VKTKRETLTLQRRGDFQIRTRGENHCGIFEAQHVKYDVKVVCTSKLDGRGFLFEQRNVDAFFQGIKRTSLSCELLTKKSTKRLVNMIMEENPSCELKSITVQLCPAPYAADMTYHVEF